MNSKVVMAAVVILCVAILLCMPIVSIWALNTLFVGVMFKQAIELTIWTYLAMAWVGILFGGTLFKYTTNNS